MIHSWKLVFFKTVIPRRLRATYGIAENGMELTKAVNMIPIEIKEDDLPEDLRRPVIVFS